MACTERSRSVDGGILLVYFVGVRSENIELAMKWLEN
jgi:hypothetical protein